MASCPRYREKNENTKPCSIVPATGLRVLHNGKPMLQADMVADTAHGESGADKVTEFSFTVQRAVELKMMWLWI